MYCSTQPTVRLAQASVLQHTTFVFAQMIASVALSTFKLSLLVSFRRVLPDPEQAYRGATVFRYCRTNQRII